MKSPSLLITTLLVSLTLTSCGLFRFRHAPRPTPTNLRSLELHFVSYDGEGSSYTIRTDRMQGYRSFSKSTTVRIPVQPVGDTLRVLMPWGHELVKEAIPPDASGVVLLVDPMCEQLAFVRPGDDAEVVYARASELLEAKPMMVQHFPRVEGCTEVEGNEQQFDCFQRVVVRIFSQNFMHPSWDQTEERVRLLVHLRVDSEGQHHLESIDGATFPGLEEEVRRVLTLIPPTLPGRHRGRAVPVQYNLPLVLDPQ